MNAGTQDHRNADDREIARVERQIARAKKWEFIRTLGVRPVATKLRGATHYNAQLFEESFGPPERRQFKNSALLFWNFRRADGREGFCLFAEIPKGRALKEVKVQIAFEGGFSFYNWTALRLNAVENAIIPPLFIGSGRSVVSRMN